MKAIRVLTVLALTSSLSWAQDVVEPDREIRAPQGYFASIVYSPDGKLLAGGTGNMVVVWNASTRDEVTRMRWPTKQRHRVAFGHDGKTLISCGLKGTGATDEMIRIFDLKTGKQISEFALPHPGGHLQVFSPDAKLMAMNGAWGKNGVDLFDLETRKIVLHFDDRETCGSCAFSNDGKRIATNTETGAVHVWDAKTGKRLKELRKAGDVGGRSARIASFSSDGNSLVTSFDDTLSVWDVPNGKLLHSFTPKGQPYSALFSPDGLSLLYTAQYGKAAILYHLVAEKETLHLAANYAFSPCFRPDFKRVALLGHSSKGGTTAGADGESQLSIFLFDVPDKAFDPAEARIEDAPLESLWNNLHSDNQLRMQRIMKVFLAAPKQTVALADKKLQPVKHDQQKHVEKRIAALDDDSAVTRDAAMKELHPLAHQFSPLLRAKHRQVPAGEVRNRLNVVLEQMNAEKGPVELRTQLRAIALLEEMAIPEARDLLTRLAQGADGARLTVEAGAALKRLNSKSDRNPPK
jgi:hypothetical protein